MEETGSDKIKLTKEILYKMLENVDNKTEMEFYIKQQFEGKSYEEVVSFLLIVEICNINKTTEKYKIALLNQQVELINKCNLLQIGDDKLFLILILTEILEISKNITEKEKKIQFTMISDNFKGIDEIVWNKEKIFI